MGTYIVLEPRNAAAEVSGSTTTVEVSSGSIIIDNSGASGSVSGSFTGNGSTTTFNMIHNLGTVRVAIDFWLTGGGETDSPCSIDWEPINSSTARTRFVSPLPNGWVVRWKAM